MSEYWVVFWIWAVALGLDLVGLFAHVWHWWYLQPFRHYLRYANVERWRIETNMVVAAWLRDAVFHLGLRILLALLAIERLLLQWAIPPPERGAFSASPFQLGLAGVFLCILIWLSIWTIRIKAAYKLGQHDVFGLMQHG